MRVVNFSLSAKEKIDRYFENYVIIANCSDMAQRAYRISRIRACLTFIEAYEDMIYTRNGKTFIEIDNFAEVEYIENQTDILVMNIYFK